MIEVTPDMVLGKTVVDAGGATVGDVVDVGVHDVRRVKYLLVEPKGADPSFMRLNVETIDAIGSTSVKLKST